MQQRQLRLGDILDDYCPRERRLTNHAVVAMVGDDVKQTRCTTCDSEHEFKHARIPRQRRKPDAGAQHPASGAIARKTPHDPALDSPRPAPEHGDEDDLEPMPVPLALGDDDHGEHHHVVEEPYDLQAGADHGLGDAHEMEDGPQPGVEEGPVHRRLIRAQLPRIDGQPPAPRQTPDFTIRQPGGRPNNRFRNRQQRGAFFSNHSGGNGNGNGGGHGNGNVSRDSRGGGSRPSGGRPNGGGPRRHGSGHKRSK